jgi:hypothetical protein
MTLSLLESDVGEEERVEGEEEKSETTPSRRWRPRFLSTVLNMSIFVAGTARRPLQRVLDPARPHLVRLSVEKNPFPVS